MRFNDLLVSCHWICLMRLLQMSFSKTISFPRWDAYRTASFSISPISNLVNVIYMNISVMSHNGSQNNLFVQADFFTLKSYCHYCQQTIFAQNNSTVLFCREPTSSPCWSLSCKINPSGRNQRCSILNTFLTLRESLWRKMLSCHFQQVPSVFHLYCCKYQS